MQKEPVNNIPRHFKISEAMKSNWNCWLIAIWLGHSLCYKIGFGERRRQNYKFNVQVKSKELVTNKMIP